jgi:cell division protein FtsQ
LTAGAGGAGMLSSGPAFALPSFPRFSSLSGGRRRPVFGRHRAPRLPRFLGTALVFSFFGAVGAIGFVAGGHDRAFQETYGEPHHVIARLLGFGLDTVTISGIAGLEPSEVMAAAGLSARSSLAFLSVKDLRDRLERVPLIKQVSVRKLYPHELVITLVEREPHALWQLNGELFVVARDGTVIDEMRDARFSGLPLVVGEGANKRADQYLALLEAAGPLKERVRAGTLVSGRRWTLKMNGIDVRLPEEGAADAVKRLVKLQEENRILDKDVIAIDLRMADRVVVRLTEEAFAGRADLVKKRSVRGKGVET